MTLDNLRNIHLRDPNQIRYDITDGADDKQIDAIVVDDINEIVYVVQGKFMGQSKVDAEPLREVLSSWIQLKNPVKLQEAGNKRLRRRLVDISKALEDEYKIVFELIVTADPTDAAKTDLKSFQESLAKDEDIAASLSLIDNRALRRMYDLALDRERPLLDFNLDLEENRYSSMEIAGTRVVLAAIPLKECVNFPGIRDGTLFRKNVRHSLGMNRVNKSIKSTIYGRNPKDFFFYHNGITAICNEMHIESNRLTMKGLSVVNGCQSLNTILESSEKVKELSDTYIMFRFYEIPERDRTDKISISTNFQTAVKPRDLRSNDRRVLNMKRLFEQRFPQGYFVTKRGEEAPSIKNKTHVIDLLDLGKFLISWHSQRPNIAYSETKIFDKYFEQLFKKEYDPDDVQSLNIWMQEILKGWTSDNLFGLNESLLAMKAYAPYHHLYAISRFFAIASNISTGVPSPKTTYQKAADEKIINQLVKMSASCLSSSLESAANEPQPKNRVFSPQNWIKSKASLSKIDTTIRAYLDVIPTVGNDKNFKIKLTLDRGEFSERWAAD